MRVRSFLKRLKKVKYHFRPLPDPTSGIITGEKIQLLCDHFIGRNYDLTYNPILRKRKDKWIIIDDLNAPFNNQSLIFCYTGLLRNIKRLIKKLQWLQNPFILVFHNSDKDFNASHLVLFDKLPNLQRIFTQNINFRDDNILDEHVVPLPIGIANNIWPNGNLSQFRSVLKKDDIRKSKLIYFHFGIKTNPTKRKECLRKISGKGVPFLEKVPFKEYLEDLSSYKYSICPEGNGIDTHRFWESLYLKVVPICKKNPVVEYFAKDFPVIVLDDWDGLDTAELEDRYTDFDWSNLQSLDMSYYKKQIGLKEIAQLPDESFSYQ